MSDEFSSHSPALSSPAENVAAVTPHDVNALANTSRALWVGTAGNIKVTLTGGTTATLNNVPDGTLLPMRATHVWSTGTTASNIVALY